MKKLVAAMVVSAFAGAFCAHGDYVWTGAEDSYWTNAANWQVNGETVANPPGRYRALNGYGNVVTNGSGKAVTRFNSTCTSGRTTIDLDGLVTVFGVVMDGGASAPRYTLGTGADQRLPFEPLGFFGAADTADTIPPILNCGFAYGQWAYSNQSKVYVTNLNQTVAVEFGDFGWCARAPDASNFSFNQAVILIRGEKGNFTFNGDYQVNGAVRFQFDIFNNLGTITVNGRIDRYILPNIITDGNYYHIVLGPNGVLNGEGSYGASLIDTWRQLNITGEGKMIFPVKWNNGEWTSSWNFYARKTQLLDVEYTSIWETGSGTKPTYGPGIAFRNADDGEGNMVTLAGVNSVTGTVRLAGYNNSGTTKHPIFQVSSMGLDGERSGLGYGPDMQLSDLATLRVTAPSENCNRTIRLSRQFGTKTEDYGGKLELTSAGTHTMASPVVCEGGDCTFTVNSPGNVNWTVPLTDTDSYRLSLVKAGAGTLSFNAANTYSGSTTVSAGSLTVGAAGTLGNGSAVTLAAGTVLKLDNRTVDSTVSAGATTVTGAGAKIVIGRHVTLELASIERTGSGTVNVNLASGSSRLKVTGLAGQSAPAWLTVNGGTALTDADGYVFSTATRWQNAAGGKFTEAGNWTDGTPAADKSALIQVNASTLDVQVDDAPATAGQFAMENETGITTLAISNVITFAAKRESRFGMGSKLLLGTGGKLVYEDEYFGSDKESGGRNTENHNLNPFALSDGAEWTIDGGHLYVTNLQGRFLVGDGVNMAATSKLSVVSGKFDFGQGGWDSGLEIRPNGLFEANDCVLTFQGKGAAESPFKMRGGRAVFSGNTEFRTYNGNGNMDKNACTVFGTGETVFKDNSKLFVFPDQTNYGAGSLAVMPETDGGTAVLTFMDGAYFTNQVGLLQVGNFPRNNARPEHSDCNANRAILNLLGTGENVGGYPRRPDIGVAGSIEIGVFYGYGELNMAGGRLNSGCDGMTCPTYHKDYTKTAPRGRVNQSGGTVYLNAFASISIGYNPSRPVGLLLGDASRTMQAPEAGYPDAYRGVYELSGGKLSLNCGTAVVGGGSMGTGRIALTGGEAVIGEQTNYVVGNSDGSVTHSEYMTNQNFMVVGYVGGQGELVISNGSFTCNEDFYLGGVWTNRVFHGYPGTAKCWPVQAGDYGDLKTGNGRMELVGGAFTNLTTFTIGAFGTGVLDMVGSAGTFKANNVVLSNDVASTVNFRADAKGVTTVDAAGRLVIAPGAQVTLDVSDFSGHRLPLFRYRSLEGEIPAITLTGTGERRNYEFQTRELTDGRREYGFAFVRGTTIFLR